MKKYFTVPITIQAQGDEVTAQGTLHFDPTVLSISDVAGTNANPDVKVGNGAPAGTRITVNTTGIQNGDLGLVINFNGEGGSPATTLKKGSRVVANVRFLVISPMLGAVSPISWNDNVFVTKIGDAFGQALPLTGVNGGVVVTGPRTLKIPTSFVEV